MNTDATITSHSAANDAALIAQCNEWQELFPRPAVSDAEFRSAAYSRRLDCMSALQISIAGTEATSEAGRKAKAGVVVALHGENTALALSLARDLM
jgi:hypothetical protein